MVVFTVRTVVIVDAYSMKIETKYSMGGSAFVMYNNRAVPIKIMGVHYSIDVYQGEHIHYSSDISSIDGMVRYDEKYVFETKEDLLKTLWKLK